MCIRDRIYNNPQNPRCNWTPETLQDQIEAEVLETADSEGVSRTPRQARDDNQRADTQRTQAWQPPSVLPDPKPQDGFVFRWIRTSLVGQSDNPNVSYRFREGWEAC